MSGERAEMAVFDAPLNAWSTVEAIAARTGYTITGLYLTHGHWDHTLDAQHFNEADIPTHGHEGDRLFYETPEVMSVFSIAGMNIPTVRIDTWLKPGQRIDVLGRTVEVRHVPGHSPGSLLFWFVEDGFAISGDALFNGGVGRTDFPNASFEQLSEAIRSQIYTLPPSTIVYPGHGPSTTVAREADSNPFVSLK